jgi:transaldolase
MDKHWFGIAIFKRSVRMLHDNGCPSKMLACSLRAGPYVAGKMRFWDIQMIAGGDIVFTMPPYVLDPLFKFGDDLDFRPEAIHEEVPIEIMDRLLRIPYVIHAYDPNGLALEEFNTHPSTVFTIENFSKAFQGLEDYVGKRIALTRQKI